MYPIGLHVRVLPAITVDDSVRKSWFKTEFPVATFTTLEPSPDLTSILSILHETFDIGPTH